MKDRNFKNADKAYLYTGRLTGLRPEVEGSKVRTIAVYVLFSMRDPNGWTRVISPVQLAATSQDSECFSGHFVDVPNCAWYLVSEEEWHQLQHDENYRQEFKEDFRIDDEVFEDFIHGRDTLSAGESLFKVI